MARKSAFVVFISFFIIAAAQSVRATENQAIVSNTPGNAQSKDGLFISWKEHLIDDESVNGGLAIRGGDGLKIADLDRDGYMDIVSVHEDSDHVRIAFGSDDPDHWTLMTLAAGDIVNAVEDVAIGDLNGDGWPDLVFACERGHLVYFQNPGNSTSGDPRKRGPRKSEWAHMIPEITKGRGSWLRVFLADVNKDGRLDVLAANKGGVDIVAPSTGEPLVGATSLFLIDGSPLNSDHWSEQVMLMQGVPNTAMPIDIDKDGDIDVLAASRIEYRTFILQNNTPSGDQKVTLQPYEIFIQASGDTSGGRLIRTNAFQNAFKDMDNDGRDDLIVAVYEGTGRKTNISVGWLQQPSNLSNAWVYYKIGDILPDWIAGIAVTDIDSDGDPDVIVGGYSGLNILDGAYSGAARDHDDISVTAAASVGRIAWFANPGNVKKIWIRHDITRQVRGMYDEFISKDMDNDGDIDFIATRGNSGKYDGLFWLEQIRTKHMRKTFKSARTSESRQLPLPPKNWRDIYPHKTTVVAPNEKSE